MLGGGVAKEELDREGSQTINTRHDCVKLWPPWLREKGAGYGG